MSISGVWARDIEMKDEVFSLCVQNIIMETFENIKIIEVVTFINF